MRPARSNKWSLPRVHSPAIWSLLLLLASLILPTLGEPIAARAGTAGGPKVFVDADSRPHRCSDTRTAADARLPARPVCSVERALQLLPTGGTITLRGGRYPEVSVVGLRPVQRLTIRGQPNESVVVQGAKLTNASNVELAGLRITGFVTVSSGSSNVAIVDNDVSPHGLMVRPGTQDVRIEHNFIHDIAPGDWPRGYAIWSASSSGAGRAERLTIKNNTITRVPLDAIQLGGTKDVLIEGNDISRVQRVAERGDHADVIQLLGSDGMVIRGNYFHDGVHGIWAGRIPMRGFVLENNVFVRFKGNTAQLSDLVNAQIRRNTFWDSGYGVRLRNLDPNDTDKWAGAQIQGVVLTHNVIERFSAASAHFALEDHNLVANGFRQGQNDSSVAPTFRDPANLDYRTPLPSGELAGAVLKLDE